MSRSFTIKLKQLKPRCSAPIKRADVFGDKRTKRVRTRSEQVRKAIREYV